MKLSIERATLLKAVAQAQSVVERRNTIPILANVLIEADGSEATFRATDLDIEVVDKAAAMVERAGSTTVSAVTLNEIVRKLPDGALVTLTEDSASGRLTIEAGRSNFSRTCTAPPVRQIQVCDFDGRNTVLPQRCLHARQRCGRRQSPALRCDGRPPSGPYRC